MFKKSLFASLVLFSLSAAADPVIFTPVFPGGLTPKTSSGVPNVWSSEYGYTVSVFSDIKLVRDLSYLFMQKHPNHPMFKAVYVQKVAELNAFKKLQYDKVVKPIPASAMTPGVFSFSTHINLYNQYTFYGYLSEGDALKILADADQRIINEVNVKFRRNVDPVGYYGAGTITSANIKQRNELLNAFKSSTANDITSYDLTRVVANTVPISTTYTAETKLYYLANALSVKLAKSDINKFFAIAAQSVSKDGKNLNEIATYRYNINIAAKASALPLDPNWNSIFGASQIVTTKANGLTILLRATQVTLKNEQYAMAAIGKGTVLGDAIGVAHTRHKILETKILEELKKR